MFSDSENYLESEFSKIYRVSYLKFVNIPNETESYKKL